jgi:hypothetical protein
LAAVAAVVAAVAAAVAAAERMEVVVVLEGVDLEVECLHLRVAVVIEEGMKLFPIQVVVVVVVEVGRYKE